jgi:hypothetical protein
MTLRRKIIDLFRVYLADELGQPASIGQIPIMQKKPGLWGMWPIINRLKPPSIECARPPYNSMNLIALLEKQFREVRSILSGDASNQRFFTHVTAAASGKPHVLARK